MKARLQDKFVRDFIFPLMCGIFVSITFTVFLLMIYAGGLSSSKDLIQIVYEADNNKTEPIISNVGNILFRKLQTPLNVLFALKEYYIFLVQSGNLELNDKPKMKKFIEKYMFNEVDMSERFDEKIIELTRNNNETFFDHSTWFIDPRKNKLDLIDDLTLQQLYIIANMNLVFKSHYEINSGDINKEYKLMYAVFPMTKLMTTYPVISSDPEYYKWTLNYENPSWCRDDYLEVPHYFYFPCRPWFKDVNKLYEEQGIEALVTTPYVALTGKSEITICVRFNDPLLQKNDPNNYVIFCLDADASDIYYTYDEFNNLLSGYFFIMRVESKVPLYYPNVVNTGYRGNIMNYEYDLNNTFNLDDITNYSEVVEKFMYNINSTEYLNNKIEERGEFIKAGVNNTYKLYPVLFNLNDDPTTPQHLFTIVYVTVPQSYMNIIYKFQKQLYPRLFFQILIFIIFGSILLLISRYLIKSIALNIVKPIRMMKRMLEGMKNKKLTNVTETYNYEFNSEKQFEEHEDNEEDEENVQIKEEEHELDDDEYIETRSTDIENLFITLLNLKKVLAFTQDTSLSITNENILNYLFAKHTFNEVKNLKGKFLCDSNVGNIALKCKKYDKAILHLVEAIKDPQNQILQMSKKSIRMNPSKHSKKATYKYSTKKMASKIGNFLSSIDTRKIDMIKKKFLDSRYPKLLYSFKKYYNNLTKLLKNKTIYDSIVSQDFYAVRERHSLEQYQNILEEYYNLSINCNDKKKQAEALLELLEFYINYRLKSQIENKLNLIFNSKSENEVPEDLKKHKESIIIKITEGFRSFDVMIYNLMSKINVNEYLKKILDMINATRKDSTEIIETPIYIINQKANYLKGKFCYYCENYSQALRFFNESKNLNLISNAAIIRDSIKMTKKILNILQSKLNLQIEEISLNIKNEKNAEIIKTSNEQMNELKENQFKSNEFIKSLDAEMNKYKNTSKDIAVLVNFCSNDENDTKNIEQAIAISQYIFENLVTSDDRFTLFSYTSHSNPLINLSYKNISTINFIRDQLEKISEKDYYDEILEDTESNLIKAAENAYDYLLKKSHKEVREKWIIGVTMDISEDDLSFIKVNNTHEKLFDGDANTNFVIIFTNKNIKSNELNLKLNFNKSGIIESNELDSLKKKMKIMGSINDDLIFLQEKYDNLNKN